MQQVQEDASTAVGPAGRRHFEEVRQVLAPAAAPLPGSLSRLPGCTNVCLSACLQGCLMLSDESKKRA